MTILPVIEEHVHAGGEFGVQGIGVVQEPAGKQGKLFVPMVQIGNQFHLDRLVGQNMVFYR